MKRESKPGSHLSAGKADDLAKKAAELQKKLQKLLDEVSELIAQSKKTMALWHERIDLFDAADQELIRRHVPPTEAFRAADLDRYRRDRDRLVVKRQFGRIGEEVLMGSRCSDEEWADWLGWPASEPAQWIVQERFDNLPITVDGEKQRAWEAFCPGFGF